MLLGYIVIIMRTIVCLEFSRFVQTPSKSMPLIELGFVRARESNEIGTLP